MNIVRTALTISRHAVAAAAATDQQLVVDMVRCCAKLLETRICAAEMAVRYAALSACVILIR